jgi:16S rRNA (cytidine1402-2'-O)-methyltransferase
VAPTLAEFAERGAGDRAVAVARELTKQFEELRRGTVAELARYYQQSPPRGEVVIVLAGREVATVAIDEDAMRVRAGELLAAGNSTRDVARALIAEHGVARNDAYRLAHEADPPTLAHESDPRSQ